MNKWNKVSGKKSTFVKQFPDCKIQIAKLGKVWEMTITTIKGNSGVMHWETLSAAKHWADAS